MKKTLLMTAFCSTLLVAEGEKFYIDMAPLYLTHDKKENGVQSDLNSHAFKWTFGAVLKEEKSYALSLESSLVLGVDGSSKRTVLQNNGTPLTNAKLYVDKLYNMNVKGTFLLSNELRLKGYLGVSRAKTMAVADAYNKSNDFQTSLSYGVGMDYDLLSDVYLYGNYMQYFSNLSAFEVGMGFRF